MKTFELITKALQNEGLFLRVDAHSLLRAPFRTLGNPHDCFDDLVLAHIQ